MAQQTSGLLSPYLRKTRIKVAIPHIRTPVLDFGCGDGTLAKYFLPHNYRGIDSDISSINEARRLNVHYQFNNAQELITIHETYRSIVMLAVLEHLNSPLQTLETLRHKLEEGGNIIITTPHPYGMWMHTLGSKCALVSREANVDHKQHFKYDHLQEIASAINMKPVVYKKFLFGLNQLFVLEKI